MDAIPSLPRSLWPLPSPSHPVARLLGLHIEVSLSSSLMPSSEDFHLPSPNTSRRCQVICSTLISLSPGNYPSLIGYFVEWIPKASTGGCMPSIVKYLIPIRCLRCYSCPQRTFRTVGNPVSWMTAAQQIHPIETFLHVKFETVSLVWLISFNQILFSPLFSDQDNEHEQK